MIYIPTILNFFCWLSNQDTAFKTEVMLNLSKIELSLTIRCFFKVISQKHGMAEIAHKAHQGAKTTQRACNGTVRFYKGSSNLLRAFPVTAQPYCTLLQ